MKIELPPTLAKTLPGLTIRPGEIWSILGSNASGLDTLFAHWADHLPGIRTVSFKDQQEIYEAELKKDDTDYLNRLDPGTPAREFLPDIPGHSDLIDALGLTPHLDTGYRNLSTGQSRKLLLASALMAGARGLLLEAPFDGLDRQSCGELDQALATIAHRDTVILIFLNNMDDIPSCATHGAALAGNRMACAGPMDQVRQAMADLMDGEGAGFTARPEQVFQSPGQTDSRGALVSLVKGRAGYGTTPVLKNIDLTLYPGDHTLVTGPNGCGKSTLLALITGDHPACYQNDLTLFGIRRGSGESIWDLKKRMGIVSPALHRDYRVPGDVLSCIVSGLFDSIGLYHIPSEADRKKAEKWLDLLGMAKEASTPFRELSFARQRLVLIARGLIKAPELLVLDEPTQGLDKANRDAVLAFLEAVAAMEISTLLYVSHRRDEFRPFFKQQLDLSGPHC